MKGRTILAAAVLLVAALPARAGAQGVGEIGGPPTLGAPLVFPAPHKKTGFPKATGEAIVIGVGFTPVGRLEIVAQNSKSGLCIFNEHLRTLVIFGSCGRTDLIKPVEASSAGWDTRRKRKSSITEVSGLIQPTVASVSAVVAREKGGKRVRKVVRATTAVPSSDLLARLHQDKPFGVFVADFRGCISNAKARVHAFDAMAGFLGSSQLRLGLPKGLPESADPCNPDFGVGLFASTASARTRIAP
jgi:hypothetical protein